MLGEISLVLGLIVAGGAFAAAEIALVSLRAGQVSRLAATHRRGPLVAKLTEDPNRFLSAVQIGISLMATLSSVFGAANFEEPLREWLLGLGVPAAVARPTSLVVVALGLVYVTLVIGELSPKRLALQRAEPIALLSAAPLDAIARLTRPVIWLLGVSSDVVVRLLGGDPKAAREVVTEEELRDMVATNAELSFDERRLIQEVLDAGDRPVREIMVPRLDVSALDAGMTVAEALDVVEGQPHSRYPVVEGGLDDAVGFVHVRDLFSAHARSDPGTTLRTLGRPLPRVPDSRRALPALAEMRREGYHVALVVDEYGGGAGIVTMEDLLEELVGDITDEFDAAARGSRRTEGADDDGPRPLPDAPVDAQLRLEEFEEETGVALPEGPYDTAAGWMVAALGRIPVVGDTAVHHDVVLTVTEMRARRVERVTVSRVPVPVPDAEAAAGTGTEGSDR
ncbi:hemolysin family protein [Kineosporia sp. A_224]|uniref:hemolysin family protein n=1 Tax=Kineosporia sp. A_224 TaxID=1962180 RepID=UPI0018E91493|nr:hemolysin family protein [Kineosporia sp. A_224]